MLTQANAFVIQQRKNILSSRQKNYNKAFQTYFYINLQRFIDSNKNCLTEIDQSCKTLNKNDKFWIETHLKQLYQNYSQKLQKQMLLRNNDQKQQINQYKSQFQRKNKKSSKVKYLKTKEPLQQYKQQKYFFHFITDPIDKRVFLHSAQLQNSFNMVLCARKKESFSSRRYRKNDDYELQSNTRYIQKLQKIKLQSTFTRLFFQEHSATVQNDEDQPLQIKRIVNRIKAISAARNNFRVKNLLTANNNRDKVMRFKEQHRRDNFLVNQLKTEAYKPKSRQRDKFMVKQKLVLNFNT